jgi:hypothetical protein
MDQDLSHIFPLERLFFRRWPRASGVVLVALFTTPLWLRLALIAWDYFGSTK